MSMSRKSSLFASSCALITSLSDELSLSISSFLHDQENDNEGDKRRQKKRKKLVDIEVRSLRTCPDIKEKEEFLRLKAGRMAEAIE